MTRLGSWHYSSFVQNMIIIMNINLLTGCALQVPFQEGICINQPFWEWCFFLGALNYCLLNNVQNQRQSGKSERGQISWNKSMQSQQGVQISKLLNFGKYHTLRCFVLHLKGFSKTKFDFIDFETKPPHLWWNVIQTHASMWSSLLPRTIW